MSTVFYLVRHAAHDQLGQFLTGRTAGVNLSEQGREQARELARRLSATRLDAIHASPQARTLATAGFVAAGRMATVEVSEELDEIDFGRWSGQSFEALQEDGEWTEWNERRGQATTAGGERMGDVAARLVCLLDRLRRALPDGTIALVSHCDVIKAGVCHYLGLPFERMDRFEIEPASVTSIVVGDWGGKLLALNETARSGEAS